jgi:hypothetical protein
MISCKHTAATIAAAAAAAVAIAAAAYKDHLDI